MSAFGYEMVASSAPHMYPDIHQYHSKYVLNGSKYSFDYVKKASYNYNEIVCMRKDQKKDELLSRTCTLNLRSAQAMINNTESIVKAYFSSIFARIDNQTKDTQRYPRGLFSVATIGALGGRVLFGVIPDLFRNTLTQQDLETKGKETETARPW